jgi:hypothetical protein
MQDPPAESSNDRSLIPSANRLLSVAAKGTWIVAKEMIKIVVRIPRWFVSANRPKPSEKQMRDTRSE